MAQIQKFRAHESLNIESAADWQVQTIVAVDSDEPIQIVLPDDITLEDALHWGIIVIENGSNSSNNNSISL